MHKYEVACFQSMNLLLPPFHCNEETKNLEMAEVAESEVRGALRGEP